MVTRWQGDGKEMVTRDFDRAVSTISQFVRKQIVSRFSSRISRISRSSHQNFWIKSFDSEDRDDWTCWASAGALHFVESTRCNKAAPCLRFSKWWTLWLSASQTHRTLTSPELHDKSEIQLNHLNYLNHSNYQFEASHLRTQEPRRAFEVSMVFIENVSVQTLHLSELSSRTVRLNCQMLIDGDQRIRRMPTRFVCFRNLRLLQRAALEWSRIIWSLGIRTSDQRG